MRAILLDIEGTTTPIDFVHQTLFQYAAAELGEFLKKHSAEIQSEISELEIEYHTDFKNQIYGRKFDEHSSESVANYLRFLIGIDRKSPPLKSLQGKIWQKGYESGELLSEVFADVPLAFKKWHADGKTIAIYSSGSILAQKLLFSYTRFGNLNSFISSYFDTNVGGKKESESYREIAKTLRLSPAEILFVSDALAELDAASEAGVNTVLSIREGNGIIRQPIKHDAVASFNDLE